MTVQRACHSCGQDSAYIRRVRCTRCDSLVHPSCRGDDRVCYQCVYRQARKENRHHAMPQPHWAGDDPFGRGEEPKQIPRRPTRCDRCDARLRKEERPPADEAGPETWCWDCCQKAEENGELSGLSTYAVAAIAYHSPCTG